MVRTDTSAAGRAGPGCGLYRVGEVVRAAQVQQLLPHRRMSRTVS